MNDAWEIAYGLDPLEAQDGALDLNNDGLSNAESHALGGNPLLVDTDSDGFTDLEEAIAGSNLNDPQSVFEGTWFYTIPTPHIFWTGLTGRVYDIYFKTSAVDNTPWQLLPGGTNIPGTAGSMGVVDPNPADGMRLYRIEVERP